MSEILPRISQFGGKSLRKAVRATTRHSTFLEKATGRTVIPRFGGVSVKAVLAGVGIRRGGLVRVVPANAAEERRGIEEAAKRRAASEAEKKRRAEVQARAGARVVQVKAAEKPKVREGGTGERKIKLADIQKPVVSGEFQLDSCIEFLQQMVDRLKGMVGGLTEERVREVRDENLKEIELYKEKITPVEVMACRDELARVLGDAEMAIVEKVAKETIGLVGVVVGVEAGTATGMTETEERMADLLEAVQDAKPLMGEAEEHAAAEPYDGKEFEKEQVVEAVVPEAEKGRGEIIPEAPVSGRKRRGRKGRKAKAAAAGHGAGLGGL